MMLENIGCKVEIAQNGQEAINIYADNKYDIILMDIQMPVMDGITAINILKEQYKNLPPIIGLSANAIEGETNKYKKLGMSDYIAKPVSLETLCSVLSKWNKKTII
jgi:CheY-like chemotaxis protein